MEKASCAVIQDLLPLYVDQVVSEDTKKLVNQHLQTCRACQKEYEQMSQTMSVPVERDVKVFEKINQKWNRKKVLLVAGSVFLTALLCTAVFMYVFYFEKLIPYSEDLIVIEQQKDGKLISNYYGKSHAGIHMTHPIEVEINGEIKNITLMNYVQTIGNSPTSNFLQKDERIGPLTFQVPESKSVDAVYYGHFDVEKVMLTQEQTWKELLQEMTLIWEK
ncbi:anti-sigma factor family protein [Paenibacillus lemnae]|uniref:Anti-sigma-W factor RsiW n=1 Tax=Paenibacillus lemnae TaxID=1330551 RepID=A0A848M2E7_PAELE|nr:zf-HC2 domain-containing protein [Paenibacillus lemnae]NMO94421.1 hypothetical protein [Paenibacillus lemnae]